MGMMPPGSHGPVIWWGGWGRSRRKPDSGPADLPTPWGGESRVSTSRLEAFSDGVFAVAITTLLLLQFAVQLDRGETR